MYSNLPREKFQFSTEGTLQDNSRGDRLSTEVTTATRLRLQEFHRSYQNRYFLQTAAFPEMTTWYLTSLVFHWNQCHASAHWVRRARIVVTTESIAGPGPTQATILLDTGFSAAPAGQPN